MLDCIWLRSKWGEIILASTFKDRISLWSPCKPHAPHSLALAHPGSVLTDIHTDIVILTKSTSSAISSIPTYCVFSWKTRQSKTKAITNPPSISYSVLYCLHFSWVHAQFHAEHIYSQLIYFPYSLASILSCIPSTSGTWGLSSLSYGDYIV